ncbi:InlB B-repeat-containing protein [Candidatus Saccharibacteria bacterium]|nr:InlB B-repeat-containing protein [Candidatus Saccharibacteria bacterium]
MFGLLLVAGLSLISSNNTAYATATQSTLTLTVPIHVLNVSLTPGHFEESDSASIGVRTDNFTGYSLSIASATSTSLVNTNNDEIISIDSALSEANFISGNYGGKFGYKPNQYITTSNNINTVVPNTNYLPIPSTTGDVIDITSAANTTDNTYSLSFGVKASSDQPAGNYTYHYIISAVGNESVYTVTYDANAGSDTVSNMPSPNPQPLRVAAGTAAASSYDDLNSNVPTRVGYTFAGWCSEQATLDSTTGNQVCGGTTYAAGDPFGVDQTAEGTTLYAIWERAQYTIHFDSRGGSTVADITRTHGEEIGTLPRPTKSEMLIEGWYPNTQFNANEKIEPTDVVEGPATYYANWVPTTFPIVWSQTGACEFHGATNGNITGTECEDYHTVKFIDTGVALYSNANYQKDYEIHFKIDHYSPTEQANYFGSEDNDQQTFVSDKLGSSAGDKKAPGIIVRRSSTNIQFNSKLGSTQKTQTVAASEVQEVSVYRINDVIYYSVNRGPLTQLQNVAGFNQQFGLTTWFGAYPRDDCTGDVTPCTNAKRIPEATLSDMYIRLGDFVESDLHTITFDGNGGTPATTKLLIIEGNELGTLPTATISGGLVFDAWYTAQDGGEIVTSSRKPSANETYWAHWKQPVTQAQFANTNMVVDINGTTDTIVVTNAAEIEPYTFSSNNSSIATVDPVTGEITGVSVGTTTITVTGTKSGTTQTINVRVVESLIKISFDSALGSAVADITIEAGNTIDPLPVSVRHGYTFEGWYTGENGTGTELTTSLPINQATTFIANWQDIGYVCKIATELHTEQCKRTSSGSSQGCRTTVANVYPNGLYAYDEVITYGTIPNSTTLSPGFAYTCDVNGDGDFDEDDERFYYIGTNNGNAALIYYRSIEESNINYAPALEKLPDNTTWQNNDLVAQAGGKVARVMTEDEVKAVCDVTSTNLSAKARDCVYLMEKTNFANPSNTGYYDSYWLLKKGDGSSDGRRLQAKGLSIGYVDPGSGGSNNTPRPVIEVPLNLIEEFVEDYKVTFNPQNGGNSFYIMVEPGAMINSQMPVDPTYTDHIFQRWYDSSTGDTVTSTTQPTGDMNVLAEWKGTVALAQVESANVAVAHGGTNTVEVTNAANLEDFTFSSSDTNIATIDAATGVVSGVAQGTATITITGAESHATNQIVTVTVTEPYIVSFNSEGGSPVSSVPVAVGSAIGSSMPANPTYAGHVFQRWYDPLNNNATVDASTVPTGDLVCHAEWKLDVQQAVISNNDLTLTAGSQLAVIVSNSADLEGYTFSTSDASIATVDANTGVITGVSAGTTNIIMTGTQSNLTKSLEVDVLAAPVPTYRVTFNSNGGSTVEPMDVEQNTALGSLPTAPTKTNNRFFGWYKDDGTFYTEVYPTTVVDGDVTYYARWIEDTTSLPIVFAETNACTFNGSAISGDYCTENEVDGTSIDKTRAYIDTAVALYDTADTYDLDYEIGFTLVDYNYGNTNQMTIVAAKWEDDTAKWPGLAVRRMDKLTTLEFTHSMGTKKATDSNTETETVHQVKVARQNGKIKFSVNSGSWVELQDLDGKTPQYFNDTVWFGSSTKANREFVGTLTDMYVKLEAATIASYEITFDANGGSASEGSRSVTVGDPLGAFPTVTPPNSYKTLSGWLNESNVLITDGTTYYPNKNETLIAQWTYNSSDTPVVFDVSNDATRGYQAIIDNWVQSPINITTFNKNTTTINNSTWGNLSELSEAQFWTDLKNNFETNHCMVPSYGDAATTTPNPTAWTNGTIDCSKPDEYDTQIGEPLNVYLYNNQTLGAQVTYANASDGVIRNLIPGNTYKWVKDGDSTVYGYVTVTSNGSDHGTRWVDTGVIRNVRDLGGLPADTNNDGTVDAYVDYGRLLRGEKLWTAPATNLTNLGITKEYDVGNPSEYAGNTQLSSYQNDEVVHYNFNYNSGDENNASSNYMKAWTAVTHIMQDITDSNNPQNIYFHCRVGADRTGTVAYILEGLLGVPDEYRYEEYELTHLSGLFDRTRYYKQKSSSNKLKFVFMMGYLQTTADILTWYYHNPNADSNLVAAFRSAMTTPIQQQQQQSSAPEGNNTNSLSNNFLQLNNTKNLIINNTEDKGDTNTATSSTLIGNEDNDDGSEDSYSDPLGVSTSAEAVSASNAATIIGATVAMATAVAAGSAAYSQIKKEN